MRTVIGNVECVNDKMIVTCNVEIGQIRGVWMGKTPPVVNGIFQIELDIKKVNSNKIKVIHSAMHEVTNVCCNSNEVVFKGICEDQDSEVYYIRFMIDWLEMLDIEDFNSAINIGDTVLFQANIENIGIYPYELY